MNTSFVKRQLALLSAVGLVMALESSAHAAVGWVSGTLKFHNKNGNYCPSNADCTGSLYPQSMYDTPLVVSNALVRVYDSAGNQIGQGSTNNSGLYTVSWSSPSMPAQIRLRFFPYQKDSRFWIGQTDGLLYNVYTNLMTTTGSSSTLPQQLGTITIGNSTAPNEHFNAYWAGERQWRETYNLVGLLQSNFTNVEIRGFSNNTADFPNFPAFANGCSGSCADGQYKHIRLGVDAGLRPQAHVMHEMGHVASYALAPFKNGSDYTWAPSGSPPGNNGWSMSDPEFGAAAFEEAFATHGGNITFWDDNAVVPSTCSSATHCYLANGSPSTLADIELTSYPYTVNNCLTTGNLAPESRWPLSITRFLWDVHDAHNDAQGDSYSANDGCFWCQFSVMHYYGPGTGQFEINEPWNSNLTALDERDGRGAISYSYNYSANFSSVNTLRADNCYPP